MKNGVLARLLSSLGTVAMILVIAVTVPLTLPKLFGYQIYGVLSGSMEPKYPIDGIVYVRETGAESIEVGDVITFRSRADEVVTHRVVEILYDDLQFITKGDANSYIDKAPVDFENLVGEATLCIPKLAAVARYIGTTEGKIVCFIIFAVSLILWIGADMLNPAKAEKKQKADRKINWRVIIRMAALAAILFSVTGLIFAGLEYKRGDDEYEELRQYISASDKTAQENPENAEDGEYGGFVPNEGITVAFNELRAKNPDTIGWIAFDNIDISYPVMQAEDDEYYLRRTFSLEYNVLGSIFMEAQNNADFSDCHTIIYGHNTKNGAMFGLLKNYSNEEYYNENPYFTIYSPEGTYRYHIFSVQTVTVMDRIYTIGFEPNTESYGEFIDKLTDSSLYDTGVSVSGDDRIITLSTCTGTDESTRFVVHAVRENS